MTKRSLSRKHSSRPGTRRPSRGRSTWFYLWRMGLLAGLAGTALLLIYAFYLDGVVQQRFEGVRWELPARVYARPLELFVGRPAELDDLEYELQAAGYRRDRTLRAPGTYLLSGNQLEFYTREFAYWDGVEPARRLSLQVHGGRIVDLHLLSSAAPIDLVRVDPVLVGSFYANQQEDRLLVALKEVPESFVQGLLLMEDRHFYEHHGVDPLAIARAAWANLRAGKTVQGGSTLTQQLVKNFFLSSTRSLWRKFNEAIMSVLLELRYAKPEILEAYLNEIYLGQNGTLSVNGLELASRFYFGRSAQRLEVHQQAMLLAMIPGPSYYDPRRHPDRVLKRRDLVLRVMRQGGVITEPEYQRALREPIEVEPVQSLVTDRSPAFLDLVRRQLRRDYREEDLRTQGLVVFSTFDPQVQRAAERALVEGVRRVQRSSVPLEGAVTVARRTSGEVLAVVGGRETAYRGFNRAIDALRPVGSLIKPVIYLTALEQPDRYSLVTPVSDTEISLPQTDGTLWQPQNYDHQFHGQIPMMSGLIHSYNLATIHLGLEIGLDRIVDNLQRLGVQRPVQPYPSLMLGAAGFSPIEILQLYQSLAADGFTSPLRAITAVHDANGNPLSRYPLTVTQAVDPAAVFQVNWALQEVVAQGTARGVNRSWSSEFRPAGKTGTTDDLRDSWFAGYTGDYAAVVWLGNDANEPVGLTGATGAMPIWEQLMRNISRVPLELAQPEGIRFGIIDPQSGGRRADRCSGLKVPFVDNHLPRITENCAF